MSLTPRHIPDPGSREPLYAPVGAEPPVAGGEPHPGGSTGPQTGAEGRDVPCSLAALRRPHPAHDWEPQPGMTPAHCPGVLSDRERWLVTYSGSTPGTDGWPDDETQAGAEGRDADRVALRDRITSALASADGWVWAPGARQHSPTWHDYQRHADAVLAVLPADVVPPSEVWTVGGSDGEFWGLFGSEAAGKTGMIDYYEEHEDPAPDYSWRPDGPRHELLAAGHATGIYLTREPVHGTPEPAPADRAAVERVRAVLETEAVVGRTALEYRGLIASALMADEAQQAECPASASGACLAEEQDETACDTATGECVHGGRPAPDDARTECTECDDTGACAGGPCAHPTTRALTEDAPTEERPACSAGLLPLGDGPVQPCIVTSPHDTHEAADGTRWTTPEDVTP